MHLKSFNVIFSNFDYKKLMLLFLVMLKVIFGILFIFSTNNTLHQVTHLKIRALKIKVTC